MDNFYEIDFVDVDSKSSGDCIAIRYKKNNEEKVHIVDGGFQSTGEKFKDYINKYYNSPTSIDNVIATHPDGDHAGGLQTILKEFKVGTLWMIRPWLYTSELLPRFSRFRSSENLEKRLKELYPNFHKLEQLANEYGVPIKEPLQGECIGPFKVLSPSKQTFLDLVVESDKTPEATKGDESSMSETVLGSAIKKAKKLIEAIWGQEVFSPNETSSENEMSVVQYATLLDEPILLTGDAGRRALEESADYAEQIGILKQKIKNFQVPHHGSRRNVSSHILDRWLGEKLDKKPDEEKCTYTAIISASREDEHHPRKSVTRAMYHRGAKVVSTEGKDIRVGKNVPHREGWTKLEPLQYPTEQEQD